MRLLVTTEEHLSCRVGQGIYSSGPAKYAFWKRYLEGFEEVLVLTRAGNGSLSIREEARADGPSVSFWPLPDFQGPWQYLRKWPELRNRVRAAVAICDAYILRVPGLVSRLAWREIQRLRMPYAMEVVADPWDGFGPGTSAGMPRPIFRRIAAGEMKRMCRAATTIHYVTENALQRRYPPGENTYAVGFSDVLLGSALDSTDAVQVRLRRFDELAVSGCGNTKPLRIGFIGSMSSLYKGPDVLLRAASLFGNHGFQFEIAIAGDGRYSAQMRYLAQRLQLENRTHFLGRLPHGDAVFQFLDSVDLFVMPSRAEGLPRAMLEAMARGCPSIGSDVGGISELLAREDLVPPGNAEALASKILEVAADPQRLKTMSQRNLLRAADFSPEKLRNAYRDFCRVVKIRSEEVRNIRVRKTPRWQSLTHQSRDRSFDQRTSE